MVNTQKSIISFANEGIEIKWNDDDGDDDDDDDTMVNHSIYSVRSKIHTLRITNDRSKKWNSTI